QRVRCIDCHMPAIVYGVMASHPSHRIELPEPARDAHNERPDACTLCHSDRTRAWAIEQRASLWPARAGHVQEAHEANDATFSQAEQQLLAADRSFFEVTDRQLNLEFVPLERREPLKQFCASLRS
ncbi:MAG TPA: hypothetical protein VHZ95_09225, partial [Polyangiales bacterium]|nr:hypothetical protein [Polyangiales bacterium]